MNPGKNITKKAQMKTNGSSFYEQLLQLYTEHGLYREELTSLVKKGIEGENTAGRG